MDFETDPHNRQFQWRSPVPPYRYLNAAQAQAFDLHGFTIVPDAFDAVELARVCAAIDPLEARTEAYLRAQPEGAVGIARAGEITFRPHLVSRSATLRDFSRHRLLLDVCFDLIGPDVRLYWDQSVYKKPGTQKEFPWHQDNGYTYVEPQQYLTCWIALTDATLDNGCPWLVPGLHRLGTLAHHWTALGWQCLTEPAGAVPVELRAGSMAVFSSLAPHRTGPNSTAEVRKAYILQYAPDGAIAYPREGPPQRCDVPDRQYLVLRKGEAV
jgi:ectoine hydroxylase-related dioxygenase (phytanoyl-CoA dioxygenase family)